MKTHWALIPTVTLSGFMSCACRLVQATAPTLPQLQKRSLFIVMALCGLNVSISQQHRMQDFDWELYFPFSCPVCSLAGGEIELCVLVESWGGGGSVVLTTLVGKLGCLLRVNELREVSEEGLSRMGRDCK